MYPSRIPYAPGDAGDGGLVEYEIDALADLLKQRRIGDAALDESGRIRVGGFEEMADILQAARGQVVHDDDAVVFSQLLGQVGAYESSPPSNEYLLSLQL